MWTLTILMCILHLQTSLINPSLALSSTNESCVDFASDKDVDLRFTYQYLVGSPPHTYKEKNTDCNEIYLYPREAYYFQAVLFCIDKHFIRLLDKNNAKEMAVLEKVMRLNSLAAAWVMNANPSNSNKGKCYLGVLDLTSKLFSIKVTDCVNEKAPASVIVVSDYKVRPTECGTFTASNIKKVSGNS